MAPFCVYYIFPIWCSYIGKLYQIIDVIRVPYPYELDLLHDHHSRNKTRSFLLFGMLQDVLVATRVINGKWRTAPFPSFQQCD